jgi:hypothetical protein
MEQSWRSKRHFFPGNWIGALVLGALLCAGAAWAQRGPSNYAFVVASGFLCDPSESGDCRATAKSANGDSYQMSGAGTFSTQGKTVTAAGTYSHQSSNGAVLEAGVWLANELVSFESYGAAPNAVPRSASGFGRGPGAQRRLPMGAGSVPTGGLAVLRIRLVPVSGIETSAVLQVNCALGDAPADRSIDGIRLSLGRNGPEFSEEGSGRVMFLSVRSDEAAKPPRLEAVPGSVGAP